MKGKGLLLSKLPRATAMGPLSRRGKPKWMDPEWRRPCRPSETGASDRETFAGPQEAEKFGGTRERAGAFTGPARGPQGPEPDPQPGASPHRNRKRRDRAAKGPVLSCGPGIPGVVVLVPSSAPPQARLAARQRNPPPPSAPAGGTAGDVGGRKVGAATGSCPGVSLPACLARRPGAS